MKLIKFEWEEIYNNEKTSQSPFYEATYRAKVFGGWLIRHEVSCDYQFESSCDLNENDRFISEEGYQKIENAIVFIADLNHRWKIK